MMDPKNLIQDPELQSQMQGVFDWFQANVQKLELAYSHLEKRFEEVNVELENKTHELQKSITQNELIQENLNTLLNSMKPGVLMVDEEGYVTVLNQSAEKILQCKAMEVEHKKLEEAFPINCALVEVLTKARKNPLEVIEVEKRICLENVDFPASMKASAILGYNEVVIGVVVTFSDLTSLRKMEEEIQQHRVLSALGEMAATVAHEIRNPLGGIGGYAGLLARDLTPDDPRRRLVDKIIQGVSSLNKIVSNLLYYTRKTETRLVQLDFVDFLDGVLSFIEIEIDKAGKEIELKKEIGSQEVVLSIDPEKLQQVLLNLLLNALQAIEEKGEISVRLSESDEALSLEISDTGCGMDEETREQIFNPFFTTKEQGTGLGLAIVRKIIELHHGRIDVASEKEQGTTFYIRLPK